jgi:hypothetical protein
VILVVYQLGMCDSSFVSAQTHFVLIVKPVALDISGAFTLAVVDRCIIVRALVSHRRYCIADMKIRGKLAGSTVVIVLRQPLELNRGGGGASLALPRFERCRFFFALELRVLVFTLTTESV